MNVVGIVGSLISQGVYSVATPFHPFGGAVDVIVVQQQDGTFRTTPWYVRFGKFQGVLKGAEKIVRISVNGEEANFHMYLDNSGEAYFIREVSSEGKGTNGIIKESDGLEVIDDSSKDNGDNVTVNICKLESSVSDPGVVQIRDECDSSGGWLERVESDNDRRFYEFQDDQSSHEGSVELSEYGSNQYESFDHVGHFGESRALDSEVVLVSVDGHILTAPISSSEGNTENLQLITPQFHLGPGEGTDFCEGNEEFSAGEGPWAAGYLNELDSASANVDSQNVCSVNNDNSAFGHQLEVCEGEKEKASLADRTQDVATQGRGPSMQSNLEDKNISIERKDVFRSCLELTELATQVVNGDIRHLNSSLKVQEGMENSQEKSPQGLRAVDDTEHGHVVQFSNDDELSSCNPESPWNTTSPDLCVEVEPNEKNELSMEHIESDNMSVPSVRNDPEWKDEQFGMLAVEGTNGSPQRPAPEDACSKSETVETQATISCEGIQTDSSIRFEISLCGKELRAGMGLVAAAEAFEAQRISEEEFKTSAPSIIKNENLIIRFREKYLTWDKAAHIVLGMAAFGLDLPVEPKDAIPVEQDETPKARGGDSKIAATSSGRRWRLWPIPFRRVKTLQHTDSNSSSEDVFVDSESGSQSTHVEPIPPSPGGSETPKKQLGRTNIPTTEQIASLNLKEGQNMVTFSFSTRVLGTQQVDAHIYLWKWNARIVISDVDGTITKSDVLGQFMPLVGKDWTQSGVARLFSAIKENGYQLLFLSARAIVQAYLTRSFLLNLKQDGKALPNGPIVISPDGLFPSLYREVIRRAPHEFKIACLEDIRALFPSDYNPFYAGFGNRDTDELSYRKIGIPKGKIFIINPKGEVAISHRIDVKSYTSLHTLVNDMFPPTSLVEQPLQEDFNSWNFWKMPLPDIEL